MTPFLSVTTTTVPTAAVEGLPATGFPLAFLLVCAGLALLLGLALRYADKLEGR